MFFTLLFSSGGLAFSCAPSAFAAEPLFCTRNAFLATGGFDEKLFAAEDAAMCWALKREGPFVVLWTRALTSGRRMRKNTDYRSYRSFRMAFYNKAHSFLVASRRNSRAQQLPASKPLDFEDRLSAAPRRSDAVLGCAHLAISCNIGMHCRLTRGMLNESRPAKSNSRSHSFLVAL